MSSSAPKGDWITVHADSRRWDQLPLRSSDIVISTPPKSGTTLMQGIAHSLLWPDGEAPGDFLGLCPWVDFRYHPIEQIAEQVGGQKHRRFLKTHTPADCLSLNDDVSYLVVHRDGRDALMSWANHREKYRPEAMEVLNRKAAVDGLAPLDPQWSGDDMDALLDEWLEECSPVRHLAAWWPLRDRDNVCLVHYANLLDDLDGEMRRIAAFLDVEVPDDLWAGVVERCRIDEMRAVAASTDGFTVRFDGGADSFFHKGTNGRWVGVLTENQLRRYDQHVAAGLEPEAAAWLESGSTRR
jgi:aryl sulfotransferase